MRMETRMKIEMKALKMLEMGMAPPEKEIREASQ